jgi:anthranilate synthase component 1
MRITPDYSQFLKLSREGNLIPVYIEVLSDSLTPFSLVQRFKNQKYFFLLESITGGEHIARYSFFGLNPVRIIKTRADSAEILSSRGGREEIKILKDPLEIIKSQFKNYRYVRIKDLPRFCGGFVGYLGYDTVRFFERLPDENPDDLDLPDLLFMEVKDLYIFDHIKQRLIILTHAFLEQDNVRNAYKKAQAHLYKMYKEITKKVSQQTVVLPRHIPEQKLKSNFRKQEFLNAVKKAKKYIREGDIIQVVLSQRFEKDVRVPDAEIYRWLRFINPSPYMYYLHCDDHALIGSSPEVFVRCEDGRAELRPIAGTRKRGKNLEEDLKLEQELLRDEKERAEHIMLVDLGRNDLGRVCKYGSVRVEELMVIEKYSHVMHIVSDVVGELRKDKDIFDLIRATFPAGTVSGAPKVRAMEIIEELENTKRGPYAGCVGYFSYSGNLDSCITIRTVIKKQDKAYIQAGAGIVADSVPEREYQETVNKARALSRAIEYAERTWREMK